MLIGNLTRDPELRYTPQGTAVCTMGLATNRSWTTDSGDKREETEFHRIVAWNKLAELCSQLLFKGRRIYVEGRLSTRSWTGTDGAQRQATEVVIDDMVILDSKRADDGGNNYAPAEEANQPATPEDAGQVPPPDDGRAKARPAVKAPTQSANSEDVNPEDIPF
jgi:single-strand DNA-binding protein